jgi:hypothetical protein
MYASVLCCAQGDSKSPMEYIQSTEPIKVNGPVVASYGSEWLLCTAAAAAAKRSSCTGVRWVLCSAVSGILCIVRCSNEAARRWHCSLRDSWECIPADDACLNLRCHHVHAFTIRAHLPPAAAYCAGDDPALGCPVSSRPIRHGCNCPGAAARQHLQQQLCTIMAGTCNCQHQQSCGQQTSMSNCSTDGDDTPCGAALRALWQLCQACLSVLLTIISCTTISTFADRLRLLLLLLLCPLLPPAAGGVHQPEGHQLREPCGVQVHREQVLL